jgi:hypothetical protein
MIICFNCSAETKKLLDSLLETGQYSDYAEAISVAVANQVILQGQIQDNGALVINENGSSVSQLVNLPSPSGREKEEVLGVPPSSSKLKKSNFKSLLIKQAIEIPSIFHLNGLNVKKVPASVASLPSDFWVNGQTVPLDRWLFGQYNKLLPAKANCRALAHYMREEPKGVPLDEAISKIAEQAVILGDYLNRHDEQNEVGRDDALSTAFPSTSNKDDKARARYANQFIGSVNKSGQVSGLLIDLKLVNSKGGKKPRLLLTEIGWQFAGLQNLILDGNQEIPTKKFTNEEVSLLLDHIAHNVPVEDFAYRAILMAISEGANTPDRIDQSLQKYIPRDTNRNLSDSFLSSQRSGAISRMADLELVERIRDGVRVSYIITNRGQHYLETAR